MGKADERFIQLNATLDRIGNGATFKKRHKLTVQGDSLLLSLAIGQFGPPYGMSPARLEDLATPEERQHFPRVLRFGNCWVRLEADHAEHYLPGDPPASFLTGSHVYGSPRPDSDIDLVISADDHDLEVFRSISHGTSTMVFGRLSCILANPEQYRVWRIGTRFLFDFAKELSDLNRPPLSRDYAVSFFGRIASALGVEDWGET